MKCNPCAHNAKHGWFGKTLPGNATHCLKCHATYGGSNRWGHCTDCHETFSGVTTFDLHRSERKADGVILCEVLRERVDQTLLGERWTLTPSQSLTLRENKHGRYWGGEVDARWQP